MIWCLIRSQLELNPSRGEAAMKKIFLGCRCWNVQHGMSSCDVVAGMFKAIVKSKNTTRHDTGGPIDLVKKETQN
jgi:hypothetical protein